MDKFKEAVGAFGPILYEMYGQTETLAPITLKRPDECMRSDGSFDDKKKNIAFHYDLSNAFYALWLDREMVYTCGYCTEWERLWTVPALIARRIIS